MTFGLEMERVYPQRKRYAREEIKNLEKSEEKRINGQAYDRNKQTIYIAPKSKIESRADYAPEPTWGLELKNRWQCLTKVSMLLVSNSLPKTIDLKSKRKCIKTMLMLLSSTNSYSAATKQILLARLFLPSSEQLVFLFLEVFPLLSCILSQRITSSCCNSVSEVI